MLLLIVDSIAGLTEELSIRASNINTTNGRITLLNGLESEAGSFLNGLLPARQYTNVSLEPVISRLPQIGINASMIATLTSTEPITDSLKSKTVDVKNSIRGEAIMGAKILSLNSYINHTNISDITDNGSMLFKFTELLGGVDYLHDTLEELISEVEDLEIHWELESTRASNAEAIASSMSEYEGLWESQNGDYFSRLVYVRDRTSREIDDSIAYYNLLAGSRFFEQTFLSNGSPLSEQVLATSRQNIGLISKVEFYDAYIASKDTYVIDDYPVSNGEVSLTSNTKTGDIKWIRVEYPGNSYDDIQIEAGSGNGTFSTYMESPGDLDGTTVQVRFVDRRS